MRDPKDDTIENMRDTDEPASYRPKLVYILSPSYSGSTLLTLMLAKHPAIATIGELKATSMGNIADYVCSCQQRVADCEYWGQLARRLSWSDTQGFLENIGTHFQSGNSFYNRILRAQVRGRTFEFARRVLVRAIPQLRYQFDRILSTNRKIVDECLSMSKASEFLDGSKDPNRLLYFLQSGLFDTRIIYLVRDGRAQSHSQRRKTNWSSEFDGAAREWVRTIRQMDRVASHCGAGIVYRQYYEDLCLRPGDAMNGITEFLGLSPTEEKWDRFDLGSFPHHILGNRMRTNRRINIALDESWKTCVDSRELQMFADIAGKINSRLGYK